MKTSTIEVGELVSGLSAADVYRQLSALPGVHHADENCVAGSATVHYKSNRREWPLPLSRGDLYAVGTGTQERAH